MKQDGDDNTKFFNKGKCLIYKNVEEKHVRKESKALFEDKAN